MPVAAPVRSRREREPVPTLERVEVHYVGQLPKELLDYLAEHAHLRLVQVLPLVVTAADRSDLVDRVTHLLRRSRVRVREIIWRKESGDSRA